MSASSVPLRSLPELPGKLQPKLLHPQAPERLAGLRFAFWTVGTLLAIGQAWLSRFMVSADSVSYLDMSDYAFSGWGWRRLINAVWSPLYPFFLGLFRRAFHISPANEIVA